MAAVHVFIKYDESGVLDFSMSSEDLTFEQLRDNFISVMANSSLFYFVSQNGGSKRNVVGIPKSAITHIQVNEVS